MRQFPMPKQDKESPTTGLSRNEASGIPASSSGGENVSREKVTDKRLRRDIRIPDMDMWAKIDRIMEEPQYAKSFNKVINAALYYGLDKLMRRLFETEETVESAQVADKEYIRRVDGVNETYFLEIARLLKDVIVNVTINKSLLSSLFKYLSSIQR